MSSFTPPRPATAVVLSLLAHVGIGQGFARLPHFAAANTPPVTAFEVEMSKEPEPEAEPVKPPEPEPVPPPEPAKAEPPPVAVKPNPAPEQQPPATTEPPQTNEPVAPPEPGFLSAPGGDGLALPSARLGSFSGTPHAVPRPLPPPRPAPAAAPAPRQVSFKDLSERPRPPRLDDALERNYPSAARLQGRAGDARVLLSVSSAGKVTAIRVVSASDPSFADACKRTLLGTAWSSPRDADGQAVGTLVPYQCKFRVSP